jgi:hypothetical protein
MEPFDVSLIIKKFKFKDPLEKKFVSEFELPARDLALVDNSDTDDQFAIVLIVRPRKYPIEEPGSQAIEIKKEFPCFVAARKLLSRVPRCTVEGTGEI